MRVKKKIEKVSRKRKQKNIKFERVFTKKKKNYKNLIIVVNEIRTTYFC
jgi:predicted secreted Zn-dependent protease